jgi:hypothetical protein
VNGDWITYNSNWNAVCNGGLALGALAVAEDEPELAGFILENGLRSLEYMLGGFAPDGGWEEGPGYWNYTVEYLTMHMAALKSALNTQFGYLSVQGLDKTRYFLDYISGPKLVFNFHDGGDVLINSPALFYLADVFNDPDLAGVRLNNMSANGWTGTAKDLLYYNGQASDSVSLPLDKKFSGAETAVFRSEWGNKNAFFAGLHGGNNNASHCDLDIGTFVIDALGERWAYDLGMDNYNIPGYFDFNGRRWTFYRKRAEGHNTLAVINGSNPDQKAAAFGEITEFDSRADGGYAVVDMRQALSQICSSARRGLMLYDNRSRAVVRDELNINAKSNLKWGMHTKAEGEVSPDGKSVTLTLNGKELWIGLDTNVSGAVFTFAKAAPSVAVAGQNTDNGNKLSIDLSNAIGNVNIAVTFVPVYDSNTVKTKNIIPVSEW